MPLRVNNLRLAVEAPEESLRETLASALGVRPAEIGRWRILRKSLDARSRDELVFVYSAAVDLDEREEQVFRSRRDSRIEKYEPPHFEEPVNGREPLSERPLVRRSGPRGLPAPQHPAVPLYP